MYGYQYDQLNRIAAMDGFTGLNVSANTWAALTATPNYRERITYDANGNILTYQRNGNKSSQQLMDDLSYHYNYNTSGTYAGKLINNQLNYVSDAVTNTTAYSGNDPATGVEDLETQAANNYAYDEIGNLVQDTKEGISNITWSVYGKILSIQKATGTITYTYDASGNRITKTYNGKTTWYVRDATGNVMSNYETDATLNSGHLTQAEVHLYGSSRLGIFRINRDVNSITKANYTLSINTFTRGNKFFELSNHLGNVLATISDRKVMQLPDNDGCTPGSGKPTLELDYHTYEDEIVATQAITLLPGFETWDNETHTIYINETLGVCPPTDPANPPAASFYRADVISANDYYPFGMMMPGRKYNQPNSGYRYGFNGKEDDNDVKGEGNQQDYGMRIYDPRLGRFLSVDPIAKKYPWYTPYQFAGNKPIVAIDVDGLEDQWTADGKHISGPYLKHPTTGQTLYSRPPTPDNPIVTYSRGSVVSKTANPSYQYMSWIGLPMGATVTPSSNVNAAFKQGFSSYLPKRFVDHFELGKGQTYTMNKQEMKDVNMLPVGIQGRTADEVARFTSILSGLKPGQSSTVDLSVLTGAATSGTLGNFYANFSGVLTRTKNSDGSLGWNFTGTMQMNDFWDFDPDPTMKKRPELAEKLVRLANKYLEGQAFNITSERVPVTQNSTQATTDYNNGQYQVVPNRVAKAKQDASKTTSED